MSVFFFQPNGQDVFEMELKIQHTNGIACVTMIGDLDSISAPSVQDQILPLAAQHTRILLDMSQVKFMSSAGLRVLLLLYRHINDHAKIALVGLREEVKDVMSITGFLEFFTYYDSLPQGLKALS
jgi:anti-sigma B factor antagonist